MRTAWRIRGPPVRASGAVPLGNLDNMEEQMIIAPGADRWDSRAMPPSSWEFSPHVSRKLREYEIDTRGSEGLAKLGVITKISRSFFAPKSICP